MYTCDNLYSHVYSCFIILLYIFISFLHQLSHSTYCALKLSHKQLILCVILKSLFKLKFDNLVSDLFDSDARCGRKGVVCKITLLQASTVW